MAKTSSVKIEQHHLHAITLLRRKAWEFSQNKNLTPQHRAQCKQEARTYAEIETFLAEHLADK